MKIKFLTVLFMISLLLSFSSIVIAKSNVEVELNGTNVTSKFSPMLVKNSVFVPVESLNFNAEFNFGILQGTMPNLIIFESNDCTIYLTIGSTTMQKNGETLKLYSPPFVKNGVTWVPLRAIAEGFDSKVIWDQQSKMVSVVTLHYMP